MDQSLCWFGPSFSSCVLKLRKRYPLTEYTHYQKDFAQLLFKMRERRLHNSIAVWSQDSHIIHKNKMKRSTSISDFCLLYCEKKQNEKLHMGDFRHSTAFTIHTNKMYNILVAHGLDCIINISAERLGLDRSMKNYSQSYCLLQRVTFQKLY